MVLEPDSPIESFQSPDAEHESAFVELQEIVKELFITIELTEVSIETHSDRIHYQCIRFYPS